MDGESGDEAERRRAQEGQAESPQRRHVSS
jgi:hypothetical protein